MSDPLIEIPREGVLIGLDYGTKRVGIAVSTREQNIASAIENYQRQRSDVDARHYKKVCEEYRAVGVIVGLPLHSGGEESQKSHEARKYAEWVASVTELPVAMWDERYTSALAEDHLLMAGLTRKKRKARMDMLAAQIMLQSYLEMRIAANKSDENEESGTLEGEDSA